MIVSWDAQTSLLSWSAIRSSEASRFLLCANAYQLLWRGPVKPRLLTPNLVHMRQPSGFEYAPLGWFYLLQTNSVNHISIFARKLSIALHFLLIKKKSPLLWEIVNFLCIRKFLSKTFQLRSLCCLGLNSESHPLSRFSSLTISKLLIPSLKMACHPRAQHRHLVVTFVSPVNLTMLCWFFTFLYSFLSAFISQNSCQYRIHQEL